MTSKSRIIPLLGLALPIAVVATFLSMLAVGSASALPPCVSGGDGRIVNNGIASYSDCEVTGKTVSGSPGGGVENHGALTLTNVMISGNSTDLDGGGIYNDGVLTLTNVVVTGNSALGFGGGIHNSGTMFTGNVTVTGNTAGTGGGGIANLSGGSAIGAGMAVANNTTTTGDGGGILNDSSFCLSAGTDFVACFDSPSGGNSLVTGNHASAGNGGGIANDVGSVALSDSTVDSNHAEGGDGGGVWNLFGTAQVVNAAISNNTASGNGGGIFNDGGSVCCATAVEANDINLTISGNSAGGNGGGVYTTDFGFTALGSSTIADNAATGSGGGVYNDDASDAFTALLNTLLARNGDNCAGTIVSDGSNLDTGATCAFGAAGDQSNVGDASVGLGTLGANGGPTQGSTALSAPMMTQALTKTSPAVDAVVGTCPPPATDERGVLRGIAACNAACDIGAFELTVPPTVTCVQSVNPGGRNIPAAGNNPKSGQNPDGFYQVSATSACTAASPITITIGSYTLAQDETIKITQSPGQSGVTLMNTMGILKIKHFRVGPGDAVIKATDGLGNSSTVTCLVPPPPK